MKNEVEMETQWIDIETTLRAHPSVCNRLHTYAPPSSPPPSLYNLLCKLLPSTLPFSYLVSLIYGLNLPKPFNAAPNSLINFLNHTMYPPKRGVTQALFSYAITGKKLWLAKTRAPIWSKQLWSAWQGTGTGQEGQHFWYKATYKQIHTHSKSWKSPKYSSNSKLAYKFR